MRKQMNNQQVTDKTCGDSSANKAPKIYVSIDKASAAALDFAMSGLLSLYAGEKAYFIANPQSPGRVTSEVGYWSQKIASLRSAPTGSLYSADEVAAEIAKRSAGPAQAHA